MPLTPSPRRAKHVLLDLEHYFAALGRSGDWNVSLLSGNPCRSFMVKQWLRGYKRFQRVAGVRAVAATPATGVHVGMMTSPAAKAGGRVPLPGSVQQATERRDDSLLFYLNEAGQRAGEVRVSKIYTTDAPTESVQMHLLKVCI